MDFVCKLYGNTYAVHVTASLVGVATLNLALPAPSALKKNIAALWSCSGRPGASLLGQDVAAKPLYG